MDLERQIKIKDEYLKLIVGVGFDYDGMDDSNEGLRLVIDELVDYARKALDNDDKSVIYATLDNSMQKNILLEELEEKNG